MAGLIVTFSVLGVTFIFQAYMFNLFIFLWILYGLLVPMDIWTRVRILKFEQSPSKSRIMRAGIAEKAQVLILMGFLAACAYFISGLFSSTGCGAVCIGVGSIVSIFMGLFLITEFSSVLENQVEYAQKTNTKVNPVTLLLAKALGIIYINLSKKVESQVNSLSKKDD